MSQASHRTPRNLLEAIEHREHGSAVEDYQARRMLKDVFLEKGRDLDLANEQNAKPVGIMLDGLAFLNAHAQKELEPWQNDPHYRNRLLEAAVDLHARGIINFSKQDVEEAFDKSCHEISHTRGRPRERHEQPLHGATGPRRETLEQQMLKRREIKRAERLAEQKAEKGLPPRR